MPRGSAFGSVSGILGIPVELLKRMRRGVLGEAKWGAMDSLDAAGVGVNVPVRRVPLACAAGFRVDVNVRIQWPLVWVGIYNPPGLNPGCFPNAPCNAATRSALVFSSCSSVGKGIKIEDGWLRKWRLDC